MVAVGTGQAIELARNGDADVLFVHHKPSEEKFVADGFGVERHEVMYNDFVIVGPAADPAGIKGDQDVVDALGKIAAAEAPFASRGDDSGTHKAELALWQEAGVDVAGASGTWYRETGSGMGPTLNTAAGMDAYALTDRGTWLAFENRAEPGDPGRGRSAPVQPVRHHPGQSRRSTRTSRPSSARTSSTGCSRTRARTPSARSRSTASRRSSRTPRLRS